MGFMDALLNAWNGVKSFVGNIATPVGNTWRGLGSSWFNANNVAREDWQRAEQSADLQLQRDLAMQAYSNEFNAQQAELQRDYETEMANTQYQRAVEDMKKAGINPIMALSNGGNDIPTGSSATASSARSGGSNYHGSSINDPLANIVAITAGLLTKGKSKAGSISQTFNNKGELVRSTITSR